MTTEHPPAPARIGYLNLTQTDVHSPRVSLYQKAGRPTIAVVTLGHTGAHPTMHVESEAGARAMAAAFTRAAELLAAAGAEGGQS